MSRAQVNTNLGPAEAVQTVARPSGVSAPVATVQTSPILTLAQSLQGIRPELSQFIADAHTDYQDRESNRAYDTIQGMTHEQAKEAVANGTMRTTESPWFRAAFQKQFGMATAAQRKREIVTAYNTEFDKDNGNVDEFLAGFAQRDFAEFGQSEFILAGLREGMAGVFDNVRNTNVEYRDGQLQDRAGEQFYTIAGEAITAAVDNGGDVNAALASIYSQHAEAGLMTPDMMDQKALELAQAKAVEGDVMTVEAILNSDPSGRGAFASRAGYADKATALREAAQAKAGELHRTANTTAVVDMTARSRDGLLDDRDRETLDTWVADKSISQSEAESYLEANDRALRVKATGAAENNIMSIATTTATDLIRSGKGYLITDQTVINPVDGSPVKLNAKDLKEQVVKEQFNALAASGASTPVLAQNLAEWGIDTNYQPWENSLSSGYTALTSALRTSDKDGNVTIPESAKTAYTLWKEMAGASNLRERHVKDSTASAVYRDAEILEEAGDMGPEEALLASASIDRKGARSSLSSALDRDKFANEVRTFMDSGWFSGAPENGGDAARVVEEHARVLVDLGISPDTAIKKAAESFGKTWTNVNGLYVNTRDRRIPPNFDEISTAILDDFTAANSDYERDEVFLRPDTNQDFWFLTDWTGTQIKGTNRFHITDLQRNPHAPTMATINAEIAKNQ